MKQVRWPIAPDTIFAGQPARLGVMGGGQLGRMFMQAAQALGYDTVVLDPDASGPAARISRHVIRAAYDDAQGLQALAAQAQAVTTEFENVPAASLQKLAQHCLVAPAAHAVAIAQDRIAEKKHFSLCADAAGVGPAPHAVVAVESDLGKVQPDLLPGILKTARLGYDGKGQVDVPTLADLPAAWQQAGAVPCVLEKRLPLALECSVIVARGRQADMVHLPVQRNLHRQGILAMTEVHADAVPAQVQRKAVQAARQIAAGLDYVGVLCVEFFVLQDGSLVVNEMAPRPHNSGHYSIDACDVSQFELQVRTLTGLPLVQPRQHSPAIMLNLLGELWLDEGGQWRAPDWQGILALPGVHLHLYGKQEPRRGRKMGHLTVTAEGFEQAREVALQAASMLGIEGF